MPRRHRRKQLYNLQFKEVKKLDAGGPITENALTGGDIDVALLFTGSSIIPKNAVLLADDKGLQPADNPVFLMRKDVATPAALKIVNAVSAKLDDCRVQQDVARHQREEGRPGRRRSRLPEAGEALQVGRRLTYRGGLLPGILTGMGILGIGAGSVALIAIAALAVLALLVIVIAPSRRVRAEPRLDPDVEAALLLGEDPDRVAADGSDLAPPDHEP